MMKQIIYLLILALLAAMSPAASLLVDFNGNNWDSVIVETQAGFNAYNARTEVDDDFVPVRKQTVCSTIVMKN